MKKLLLIFAIIAIYIGFCSSVLASPTLPETGSSQAGSSGTYEEKKDSQFFLVEWLYWFLDDVLGIKDRDHDSHYYPASSSSNYSSGDSSSGNGSDDSGWIIDPGDIDWDYDPGSSGSGSGGSGSGSGDSGSGSGSGNSGSGSDPGNGGWDSNTGGSGWDPGSGNGGWDSGGGTNPVQTIPAPGALILGCIGTGIINWLRRHRAL